MRSARFAILLAAFAGCGVPSEDSNNHGYGWSFDEIATDGLRVRYANESPPRLALVDDTYIAVATCMTIELLPPGPLVIFWDDLIASAGHDAMTFLDTGTIVLDSQITTIDWNGIAGLYPVKHEMVHFLLERTGFPRDQNANHMSPYFDSCGH
jgi:hypothetical protein